VSARAQVWSSFLQEQDESTLFWNLKAMAKRV